MGVRLPTILGKAIDDVWKTLNQEYDEGRVTDLVECVHRMEDLMNDLQGNSKLRPIIDDGAGDIALWNKVHIISYIPPITLVPVDHCTDVEFHSLTRIGNCKILPWQGLYERALVVCRGIQVPSS